MVRAFGSCCFLKIPAPGIFGYLAGGADFSGIKLARAAIVAAGHGGPGEHWQRSRPRLLGMGFRI